ncbi:hypothetical protein ABK040_009738 [Willaertia magna]
MCGIGAVIELPEWFKHQGDSNSSCPIHSVIASSLDEPFQGYSVYDNGDNDITIESIIEEQYQSLSRRGPDHISKLNIQNNTYIVSTLSLRGQYNNESHYQPYFSENEHLLLYNGELYNIPLNENDTFYLYQLLINNSKEKLNEIFTNEIKGEFAFIYLNIKNNNLTFGRDFFGRKSFCFTIFKNKYLIISSVSSNLHHLKWYQINNKNIYELNLNHFNITNFYTYPSLIERKFIYPTNLKNSENNNLTNIELYNKILLKSVYKRITNINNNHNYIGILFSGGIDSLLITIQTHLQANENIIIELYNVSFGNDNMNDILNNNLNNNSNINNNNSNINNNNLNNNLENDKIDYNKTHDRKCCMDVYKQLIKKFPNRIFHLYLININKQKINKYKHIIQSLIYPNITILDYTIGCVLFFASKGKGYLYQHHCNQLTQQVYGKSKVLLLGNGADETCGGYRRYFKRFKQSSWDGLNSEMDLDLNRIWHRNMGRDDRIISYFGKEGRYPYLDEDVIKINREEMELCDICNLNERLEHELKFGNDNKHVNFGDKLILRNILKYLYQLEYNYPKKAMQFATNSSKVCGFKRDVRAEEVLPNFLN